jgi:MarR family transcriptional regulator, organic hydroperoxide resistance regulator
MASSPQISLNNLLCLDLYAASRAVIKAYHPLLTPLGLTYPQYLVMIALWESGPLAVNELSKRLSLDSGTLSPLLKRLEAAGLIDRTRSNEDERRVSISLTRAGEALREKVPAVQEAVACAFHVKGEALRDLQETLRTITRTMGGALTTSEAEADGAE